MHESVGLPLVSVVGRPTHPRETSTMRRSLEERFWAKVEPTDDGCWLWTGSRFPAGYGRLRSLAERYAHRCAWMIFNGPIPDGLHVLHHCDNPPCVRPDHLWLGTPLDNMRDRDAKGRGRHDGPIKPLRGSENGNARLNETSVLEIIRLAEAGVKHTEIARSFGVHPTTVDLIAAGRRWAHLRPVRVDA